MDRVLQAATDLAEHLSPAKISALADKLGSTLSPIDDRDLHQLVTTPPARAALARLRAAWTEAGLSGEMLAGLLLGSSFQRERCRRETSVELVWTGPTTPFVATRRTEQVLLDLVHRARTDLFLVSFVAYDVPSVVDALNAAAARNVVINFLLETSISHGGSLSVDPVATVRARVPAADLFVWTDRPSPFIDGKVHAKVVVADGSAALVTSANLTGHALEKNIEAGVLVTGGEIPKSLRSHLLALIDTKVIRPA